MNTKHFRVALLPKSFAIMFLALSEAHRPLRPRPML
jgi:hypothetical protein